MRVALLVQLEDEVVCRLARAGRRRREESEGQRREQQLDPEFR